MTYDCFRPLRIILHSSLSFFLSSVIYYPSLLDVNEVDIYTFFVTDKKDKRLLVLSRLYHGTSVGERLLPKPTTNKESKTSFFTSNQVTITTIPCVLSQFRIKNKIHFSVASFRLYLNGLQF